MYKENISKIRHFLFLHLSIMFLAFVSCQGPKLFGIQEDYSKYSKIHPPYNQDVVKALEIASVELLKLGIDTSGLEIIVMEGDATYLIAFGPSRGVDTVYTDTSFYLIVHADGHGDVVISKKDFKVLKLYQTF